MTETQPQMPEATAEHKLLMTHVGQWNVDCKFYMDPSQPPMETSATDTVEAVGEFWTVCKFQASMMGMPFTGRATLGYEPSTGRYVSTWIDSMAPVLCLMHGETKGDTLTMRGDFYSCMTNSVLAHRTTEKHISKDERIFEMFCTLPDGVEIKMMSNHYRRA